MRGLVAVPVTFRQAVAFVNEHHRNHDGSRGWRFGLGVTIDDKLVGVAMAGRPVARMADDGFTLEVNRVCTLGDPNACSFLYARVTRAAKALGYRRILTYTLSSEPGTSLRAAGWKEVSRVRGAEWSRASRRRDASLTEEKIRWEAP